MQITIITAFRLLANVQLRHARRKGPSKVATRSKQGVANGTVCGVSRCKRAAAPIHTPKLQLHASCTAAAGAWCGGANHDHIMKCMHVPNRSSNPRTGRS